VQVQGRSLSTAKRKKSSPTGGGEGETAKVLNGGHEVHNRIVGPPEKNHAETNGVKAEKERGIEGMKTLGTAESINFRGDEEGTCKSIGGWERLVSENRWQEDNCNRKKKITDPCRRKIRPP